MTLDVTVKLGSLLAATAIGAMAVFFSVSDASALQACKGATHNCGVPPEKSKCHTCGGHVSCRLKVPSSHGHDLSVKAAREAIPGLSGPTMRNMDCDLESAAV